MDLDDASQADCSRWVWISRIETEKANACECEMDRSMDYYDILMLSRNKVRVRSTVVSIAPHLPLAVFGRPSRVLNMPVSQLSQPQPPSCWPVPDLGSSGHQTQRNVRKNPSMIGYRENTRCTMMDDALYVGKATMARAPNKHATTQMNKKGYRHHVAFIPYESCTRSC